MEEHIIYPLLPVKTLVGGGFFVLGYPVVSGGFRWFSVANAVELHGRFKGSKRKKDPHPRRVRVSLKIILQLVGYGHIGDAFRVL